MGKNALIANTTGEENTSIGYESLDLNTTGSYNTSLGAYALSENSDGSENTAIGSGALSTNASGNYNTAIGSSVLAGNIIGEGNTAIGNAALLSNTSGNNNTAIGGYALAENYTGSDNTAIGKGAGVNSSLAINNTTAIGSGAMVTTSNTIQLGSDGTGGYTPVENVRTSGTLTAGAVTYPNTDGTSGQVLITDGSGMASWATPASVSEADDQVFATTAGQISFTLSQTPTANSKVKMYINGIKINKLALSVSGTTVTYDPAINGNYAISVNDRVQFEYMYQ
jgi:hypothetical protein